MGWTTASSTRATSQRELRMLERMGALMGVALRTKTPLPFRLAPDAWRLLLLERPTLDDLRTIGLAPRDADRSAVRAARVSDCRMSRPRRAPRSAPRISCSTSTTKSRRRRAPRRAPSRRRARRRRRMRCAPPRAPLVHVSRGVRRDVRGGVRANVHVRRRLDGEEVELKPGGASLPLTFDTREEWCALIEEARRREGDAQVAAVRRGLAQLVPLPANALHGGGARADGLRQLRIGASSC